MHISKVDIYIVPRAHIRAQLNQSIQYGGPIVFHSVHQRCHSRRLEAEIMFVR